MKVKELQQLLAQYQGDAEVKIFDRKLVQRYAAGKPTRVGISDIITVTEKLEPEHPGRTPLDFVALVFDAFIPEEVNSVPLFATNESFPCKCGGRFHLVEREGYVCDKCEITRIFKPESDL